MSPASSMSSIGELPLSSVDRRRFCFDFISRGCFRQYCKFPHLRQDQITQLPASIESASCTSKDKAADASFHSVGRSSATTRGNEDPNDKGKGKEVRCL